MTRKQAVLLMVVVLAGISFRQNLRWPEHFWDAPAFRTFRFEDLPEVAKLLSRTADEPEPPTPVSPEATSPTDERKSAAEKPEEKADEKPKKKPASKEKKSKAADKPKVKAPLPERKPEPVRQVSLPQDLTGPVDRCYTYATQAAPKSGTITARFTEDANGAIEYERIIEDTLELPVVRECVERALSMSSLHDPDPTGVEHAVEARLTFGKK